jgi:hypothetical protein
MKAYQVGPSSDESRIHIQLPIYNLAISREIPT